MSRNCIGKILLNVTLNQFENTTSYCRIKLLIFQVKCCRWPVQDWSSSPTSAACLSVRPYVKPSVLQGYILRCCRWSVQDWISSLISAACLSVRPYVKPSVLWGYILVFQVRCCRWPVHVQDWSSSLISAACLSDCLCYRTIYMYFRWNAAADQYRIRTVHQSQQFFHEN